MQVNQVRSILQKLGFRRNEKHEAEYWERGLFTWYISKTEDYCSLSRRVRGSVEVWTSFSLDYPELSEQDFEPMSGVYSDGRGR